MIFQELFNNICVHSGGVKHEVATQTEALIHHRTECLYDAISVELSEETDETNIEEMARIN